MIIRINFTKKPEYPGERTPNYSGYYNGPDSSDP
jgi:hypothetical protein